MLDLSWGGTGGVVVRVAVEAVVARAGDFGGVAVWVWVGEREERGRSKSCDSMRRFDRSGRV